MKKTLLAIAALAATSGAFAQSSLTIYGVLDASIENINADDSLTRVSSDNLSSSRLGFKGTEDIGGGLKAGFVLEHNVKVDTGAAGNTRMWDRAAWVGLSGSFGELRLGRQDSSIGDIAGNVLSAQTYDDFKFTKTRAGDSYRREDNAITYILPVFVPGLAAQIQYSTNVGVSGTTGTEDTTDAGKAWGLSVKYAAGPFAAGLGYLSAEDETNSVTANAGEKGSAVLVYAGYDFGVAKVTAYYDNETKLYTNSKRLSLYGAKVSVPVTSAFTVIGGLSQVKHATASTTEDDGALLFSLKGVYALSKRTSLYGMLSYINNEDNAKLTLDSSKAPVTAGDSVTGIAFGVRHTF
ncbi:porin [Aquabacterium sp.]|uniref:porin n=1 Tax=Aquabacterium sp. TaxID=1872578 RepID=UPI0035B3F349